MSAFLNARSQAASHESPLKAVQPSVSINVPCGLAWLGPALPSLSAKVSCVMESDVLERCSYVLGFQAEEDAKIALVN